jgi:hypothetical protein
MVTTGSQKIIVWGPGGTPLGILRVKKLGRSVKWKGETDRAGTGAKQLSWERYVWIAIVGNVHVEICEWEGENGHFGRQWLWKENTINPATSQHHKLGGWLFPPYILETINTFPKTNKAAYTIQGQNILIHITWNRWSVITDNIRISVKL